MNKLTTIIVAVALLVALVVLAAPVLVPVDAIKTRLTDAVRAATGRELRLDGGVRLSLVPVLAVQAENVAFANAPGGVAPDMARLKSLEVELRLWPLLHGQIEVARLVLTDPVIALEVDRNGRGNWVFDAKQAAASSGVPAASGGGGVADLHLDDIRLVGGRVSWLDQRSKAAQALEKIDLKLSLPGMAGPLTAEGSVEWNGEKIALAVTAAAPGRLLAGGEGVLTLRLGGAPVKLQFDGMLTGLPPRHSAGKVELTIPSLRKFAAWASKGSAVSGDGLGNLAIKGRLGHEGGAFAFTDADITLDAMHAKGALTVATGGARPLLKGHLVMDRLDINPYLPPPPARVAGAAGTAPPPAGAEAAAGWSDAPIDVSALRVADADLDLSVGSIAYRQFRLDASRLALLLQDGQLAADLKEITLYGGAGKGRLGIDARGAEPALDLSVALDHVQIEPLLTAAAGMDRLSGSGAFSVSVTGKGGSQRALIGTLAGKGALSLADGIIKGVNLPAVAQRVLPNGSGAGGEDHTTFGSLNATFTIDRGVLHNGDLLLKTRLAPVTGEGTVNLPARTIDYRAIAQIAGGVRVPIQISGPLDHPSYRPELGGTLDQLRTLAPGSGGSGGTVGRKPADLLRGLLPR